MNNDLISRSAAVEMLREKFKVYFVARVVATECASEINNMPAVDAEPVRHGRYGFIGMDMMAGSRAFYFGTCSVCQERINFEPKHKNYCPNCGAKMDGKECVPRKCGTCSNDGWDMPQCRECNEENGFKWYKRKTDAEAKG